LAKARRKVDPVAALAAVSEADVKQTLDAIGKLQVNTQGMLAGLGATMATKIAELETLDTAIDVQTTALKELHDIEAQAESLKELENEEAERCTDFARAAADRRIARSDEDALRIQLLTREAEAHDYDVKKREERSSLEHRAVVQERQRVERIRMDDVNLRMDKQIAEVEEREQAVTAKEDEIAAMPEQLAHAVDEAVAHKATQLSTAFGHEKAMLTKDAESRQALAQQQIDAGAATIEDMTSRIIAMETDLKAARDDSKAVAERALEASSGRQALETLQETLKVQAASGTKPGR
jgi:hypothetical protein